MNVKYDEVDEIQDIIKKLETVAEKRIRSEERFKHELKNLADLGCKSIEAGTKEDKEVGRKLKKLRKELKSEFKDFMEDYSNIFD